MTRGLSCGYSDLEDADFHLPLKSATPETTTTMAKSIELGELIYESDSILIYRGYRQSDRVPVIVKALKPEHPRPTDVARLKYEYAMVARLALPGIVKVYGLEKLGQHLALVMEDLGGTALSHYIGTQKLGLKQVLQIASVLADTLGAIHARGVIHRDVKPQNIIIQLEKMDVKLTDFGFATYASHEIQGAGLSGSIQGTLAYMSPEQTGRRNGVIDCRSDLYSLGVTVYELLTGVRPFTMSDSLELIHSHLARTPPSPKEVSPEIPEILSSIVMKLLSKSPEDRYQSASGLKADLETCRTRLTAAGAIASFPLGSQDFVTELRIPQKLYGRESELATLLATWNRASQGAVELLLISGYSGIGKSVLIHELHKPIVQSKGHFIVGKFDQLNRSVPYAAVVHAFRELIRTILTESDNQLAKWKDSIQEVLGKNAKLITDIIPELELLIGPQPSVPPLAPVESQNRFNLVFHKFCLTLATTEHPLVLFLDDLQWADPASLKLLRLLLSQADMGHLLIIGAYRDNEVDENHIFSLTVAELREEGTPINGITLRPLGLPVVNQIIADTLSTTPKRAAALVEVVFAKTQGNPFFMRQFLQTLHDGKLLWFDAATCSWAWDIVGIRGMQVTENVVDFMADKLRRLSAGGQHVLTLAASIGHKFDLKTLSLISETSPRATVRCLEEALREGFIYALDAESRFLYTSGEDEESDTELASTITYRFSHDRVQQAAYSLIETAHTQALHLRIGRLMLQKATKEQLENDAFDILGHLNIGAGLLTDPNERLRVASLNLMAGRRAKAGLAYDAARNYFRVGVSLLAPDSGPDSGPDCWQAQYQLSFALHSELAESESLSGGFARAEEIFTILAPRAKTTLDQVHIHSLHMIHYQTLGRFKDSITTALSALALLGITIPQDPEQRKALFRKELADLQADLAGRKPAEFGVVPATIEPERHAAHKLLADLAAPALATDFTLGALAVLKQVSSSIRGGNSDTSAFGYMIYARLLMGGMGRSEDAYEFARLGIALNEKFGNVRLSCMLLFTFSTMVHFFEPLQAGFTWLSRARQAGLESGDFPYLSYTCIHTISNRLCRGDDLESVQGELEQFIGLMQRTKDTMVILVLTGARQVIKSLRGQTRSPLDLSDDSFDEASYMSTLEREEFAYVACWYHSFKLQLSYLHADYSAALAHMAAAQKKMTPAGASAFFATEISFYACLAMSATYDTASTAEQQQYKAKIDSHLDKLAKWAGLCPSNYAHKHQLVMAEVARISGEEVSAMALYDQAIETARTNEFPRDEAMANELAARYHLSKGRLKCARGYITDAYQGYLQWGAPAKADELAVKLPGILTGPLETAKPSDPGAAPSPMRALSSSTILSTSFLDVETVIRSAQALAGEVILENVVAHLLDITMKNAGAQRGVLILEQDGNLIVEASVTTDPPAASVGLAIPLEKSTELPLTIVQYVARTKSHVVISDATREARFAADPYLAKHHPKSILCLAMVHQGRTTGIFYLEHAESGDAFSLVRVELLKLFLVQAAISVENSRLYQRLHSRTEALHKTEVQLRHEFEERERSEQARTKLQQEIISIQSARLAELSTPLIPITNSIMVMPLIGMMDRERAQQVLSTSLQGVEANSVKVVIIDITGVKLVDNEVAATLINTASALRLLGAQAVITGIRAEVARKLVMLQVDFGLIMTKSTLQSGIAYALQLTGTGSLSR